MSSGARSEGGSVSARLSVMMFLEFFIWGGWYVTVSNYMGAHGMGGDIYIVFMLCPIAAIISPFFLGMIADRFFSTEKVLGVMSLLGGIFLLAVPVLAPVDKAPLFIPLLLLHALCYMPTLSLTNSLAFHHVTDQEKQFPIIRLFDTVGWIVAGVFISKILTGDEKLVQFYVAGGAAVLLGLYSFTLPHTPPPGAGKKATVRDILGLDSLALLKKPSFAVFMVSSLLICIPLSFYYAYAPVFVGKMGSANPGASMSWGQICEVGFMFLMPMLFTRLGVKWMLFAGMMAWVVRYGLFAAAAPNHIFAMVMIGVILHGMCYDFFFVTGQIYVDKRSTARIRGQAQGFLVLVTQGVGMLIGSAVAGAIYNANTQVVSKEVSNTNWSALWTVGCVSALVIAVLFAILFKDDSEAPVENGEAISAAEPAPAP